MIYDTTKPSNQIIAEQIRRTWYNRWLDIVDGPYPCFKHKVQLQAWEVDHTDGIGTKGAMHWHHRTFRNAVLDALAMNLNDLAMVRARPFKIQNHIILPNEDMDAITSIMTALADECVSREICITGGETSFHDNIDGMDLSITMSGLIHQRYTNLFNDKTILIGLASSGLHSNGFTHVRDSLTHSKISFNPVWLTPTRIYDLPDWPFAIDGIQHITGGGFTKLKSKMKNVDVIIHRNHGLKPQSEFYELYKTFEVDRDKNMYKTFNCGIGMILAVQHTDVTRVLAQVGGEVIGEVRQGNGKIAIESMFSKEVVIYD